MACSTECGSLRIMTVRLRSSGWSELIVSKTRCQFCSHELSTSSRLASACMTNSRSRLRSGFSPSLVRKEAGKARAHVARHVLHDDRHAVGLSIGRGKKLLIRELGHGAIGKALV